MKNYWTILLLLGLLSASLMMTAIGRKRARPEMIIGKVYLQEREAIMKVISEEYTAFNSNDFDSYASHWVHAPYVRNQDRWERSDMHPVEGWEAQAVGTEQYMEGDQQAMTQEVVRENINLRIYEDVAWVTFDQYRHERSAEGAPYLGQETRILEKHDGQWKLVYSAHFSDAP